MLFLPVTWFEVFGESWQLRSHLKADIRVQVRNLETLFPENGTQPLRPPHEIQASIREQVSRWTLDGSYLHDTVPTSVRISISTQDYLHLVMTCYPGWTSTLQSSNHCIHMQIVLLWSMVRYLSIWLWYLPRFSSPTSGGTHWNHCASYFYSHLSHPDYGPLVSQYTWWVVNWNPVYSQAWEQVICQGLQGYPQ